ncbi:hypothetical protein C5B92_03870 [Rathayibacter sp. AY1A4]|nr:hypothetical protein C5B92_03870 [Rathayibacter sp. AY1A4]
MVSPPSPLGKAGGRRRDDLRGGSEPREEGGAHGSRIDAALGRAPAAHAAGGPAAPAHAVRADRAARRAPARPGRRPGPGPSGRPGAAAPAGGARRGHRGVHRPAHSRARPGAAPDRGTRLRRSGRRRRSAGPRPRRTRTRRRARGRPAHRRVGSDRLGGRRHLALGCPPGPRAGPGGPRAAARLRRPACGEAAPAHRPRAPGRRRPGRSRLARGRRPHVPPRSRPPAARPRGACPVRARLRFALAAVAVLGLGLALRFVLTGLLADLAGGVAYVVLVALLIAVLLPRIPGVTAAGIALAWSIAMEQLQAIGVAARLVELWAPLRLVVGTTFSWLDIAAYVLGAVVAAAVHLAVAPREQSA